MGNQGIQAGLSVDNIDVQPADYKKGMAVFTVTLGVRIRAMELLLPPA